MRWNFYRLTKDKTVEKLPVGEFPSSEDYNSKNRRVGDDTINEQRVSTVFLQMDHSFQNDGSELFETMIFGGEYDGKFWRYSTWDDAKSGHDRIVDCLKNNINPNI